ncbi:bromodomain adjacent to zinc finger domain protein 2B-like isoform X5 [Acipenser ruthenus]|uniref:bromodomain adjacent to zinc finger domain protein 2B-like isoform X5 n=1 Tax=Acipenser ruthenus TaxID=7906 RepID=UPI0027426BF4|nr:bromodomain adjacent to zinc finger domain protein 2B-like isoform X5 [Acipenser ruthenus]
MESGERLASPPSASSSVPSASSTATATAPSKGSLSTGATALSSTLTTCAAGLAIFGMNIFENGHLFRAAGDQPFTLSTVSSAFPMVSHPAFGLYTTSSGRSEFGGLGTLGASAALATHPQLGPFPEWWRTSDAHARAGAAFFPPLLGMPPLFAAPVQNHDSISFQSRTASKNGRGAQKGMNGAVNGSSITLPSGMNTSATAVTVLGSSGQTKVANSSGRDRKCNQEQTNSQLQDKAADKPKDKKLRKKLDDSSSNSDSESGSSSDTSSEGVSSSDSEDLEEDDDDDDDEEDDDDQSNEESEDDDSDSESEARVKDKTKVLMQNVKEATKDGQKAVEDKEPQDKKTNQQQHFASDPEILKQPQVLSQQLPLVFQSSEAKEETGKKHLSVIHSTGLTATTKPLALVTQARREASPKPLITSLEILNTGNKNTTEEPGSQINDLRLKQSFYLQEQFKLAFPVQLKKQQELYKNQKKVASALYSPKPTTDSPASQKLTPANSNHSNLFLSNTLLGHHQPNGVIQSAIQDAPLALTTKSRSQPKPNDKQVLNSSSTSFPSPVNLCTSGKNHSSNQMMPTRPSTSPALSRVSGKDKAIGAKVTPVGKAPSHLVQSLLDQFRGAESDFPSSKDSDDSIEDEDDEDDDDDDDDEDDEDEEDSDDSQSESESNFDSDSDGSEDDEKDHEEMETDTEGEKTPLKLNKTAPSPTNCTPLKLQVIKAPNSAPSALLTEPGSPAYRSTPSSSYTHSTSPGSAKRRRVTDEREIRIPLEYGWQREARIREIGGRLQGEVAYYAPCGKKLRQYPEVMKYLTRNGITDITRDNFSFSAKIRVGDFYEARDGPQGMQWSLLNKEEVLPRIRAMEGRKGRPPNPERTRSGDGSRMRRRKGRPPNVGASDILSNTDAKLIRKLEAQEIARQAAQIKLMRKLEKQALARAAKEARKQQAIMAAEERRKQKEQMKILKQQEKIKRVQQIRMEKELRAQQILEAKRKKKEEAANAKISEAEKRTKEKEMRRQQAVILKHQELERHRLDMERERRRQHMMLLKAMDARKKAEKERLKQEKKDEKRLNKERKLELRRLELEIAKELKKPNEDMCLADHKPLPELNRIPGLVLSGSTFSDCLMVVQFLRNFGKVLGFDISVDVPHLSVLQEGLLNVGDSMGEVQDLLVRLLSAVVCDPGLPPGCRAKTALGDHLTNIGINRDNVSEILQIYMEAHCGQTELTESLETKAFQAHTPTQKASILAFLVNELACSKSVVSEIDKNIDHMSNLRRDKWIVEGKLRKLRIIHAKKTGKRDTSGCVDGGEDQALGTPTPERKRKRKGGDSDDDDDDDDDDSDEQGDEEEDDEDDGKKGKKVEACEDEDDGYQTTSVEELEKQIEKLTKQQSQFRRKLFEASHSLRSMMFGQDRYKRRYWVLPQCGGVFVEALESGEGQEELAKERERLKNSEIIQIKEEPPEVPEEKPLDINISLNIGGAESSGKGKEKDNPNLFLQKPGSFSKLSKLLEVAKMSPESDTLNQKPNGSQTSIPTMIPSPSHTISQSALSPQPAVSQGCSDSKPDSTLNLFNPVLNSPGKFYNSPLLSNDQLLRVLTEKSGQWFSLLPRTPCDDTSVTHHTMPTTSSPQSSTMRPKSPSPSPAPPLVSGSLQNPVGLNPFALSALQMKPGLHLMGLPFCGWPSGMLSPNLPFTSSPLPHALNSGFGAMEGNSNPFLAASISTSKSESPMPQNEKPPSAPSPAIEVAKPVDYPCPRPIPEEMQTGWWRVTDAEELRTLAKVLHLRGIREKALQKQIQKHMDYISQACSKNRDVAIMEINDNEENQVTQETLESWCVEEQAMDMDIAILQQVEELERRVASASLQVKGWIYPEPHSEREDLVYYEHKSISKLQPEEDNVGEKQDCSDSSIVRHINNPLDIAVTRLAELERNIERRYLKSPLSTTIQIKLDNVGTVTVPAPAPSNSGDGDGGEEDIAPGLKVWRKALSEVRSAAQVALCIQQLQKSIAWEKSIMKVYCQICRKGDNEELLLLCDGCDKGCHTYCHRPKITTIPEGDWFCPACIAKASGQSPRSKKLQIRGVRKGNDMKCSKKLSVAGDVSEDDAASTSSTPKKGGKEPKKRKGDENTSLNQTKQESSSCVKKAKTARDNAKDLALCSLILSELETHEDAWPFLLPVNLKLVSGYKKVIKKPMAFATIREKLDSSQYQNLEAFVVDVRLVFDNCETFNEDDSDIGRAGHNMRRYFEIRWTELFKTS